MANILIAEDNALVRAALADMLEHAGHSVAQAGDGREALESLKAAPADLVVMDIFMPVMDGIELIGHIRKAWPTQKVLALSGGGARLGADTTIAMVADLGADVVMQKPVDNDTLLEKIDALLAG